MAEKVQSGRWAARRIGETAMGWKSRKGEQETAGRREGAATKEGEGVGRRSWFCISSQAGRKPWGHQTPEQHHTRAKAWLFFLFYFYFFYLNFFCFGKVR